MWLRFRTLALSAFLAGTAWAGALPSPSPVAAATARGTAPAAQVAPAGWAEIVAGLADADFARREAAQKELNRIDWRQMAFLRQATESAADPEIKARLAARVGALEEQIAFDPPPISVTLKDAFLAEVADELSKAMGMRIDTYPNGNNGAFRGANSADYRYTLAAVEKPFWEVFLDLSRQRGLSFVNYSGSQWGLATNYGQGLMQGTVAGPLAVFPSSITRQRNISFQNPQGPNPTPETITLSCAVLIDPRMRIVKYAGPVFTDITDDAGNTLVHQRAPELLNNDFGGRNFAQLSASAQFPVPEKRGTRIVSAKGMLRLNVQTTEDRLDLTEMEKKVGQNVEFAGRTFRLRTFNVQSNGNGNQMNVSVYFDTVATNVPPGQPNPPTFSVLLVDSAGKVVYSGIGNVSLSASGVFAPPFTVRFTTVAKTRDLDLPFELKDLPLP